MKQGSEDHPKFRMLARFLKIPLPYANGIMERLWLKAGAFKPSGAVGEWSNVEIAENCAMPIETDVDAFVEALVQARFLDRVDGPARLAIHDWRDHCTHYTHNKLANHQQFFADGKAPKIERLQGRDRRERASAFYNASVSAQKGDMSAQNGDMSAQKEISRSTKALGVSAQKGDMSAHGGSNARARPTPTPTPTPVEVLSPSVVFKNGSGKLASLLRVELMELQRAFPKAELASKAITDSVLAKILANGDLHDEARVVEFLQFVSLRIKRGKNREPGKTQGPEGFGLIARWASDFQEGQKPA